MLYLIAFLTALLAYLIGSISGSIIISKATGKGDIRESGSKNAGTTNMLRVHGKKLAVFTLLIDVLKGVLAVLLGILVDYIITNHEYYTVIENHIHYLLGRNPKGVRAVETMDILDSARMLLYISSITAEKELILSE